MECCLVLVLKGRGVEGNLSTVKCLLEAFTHMKHLSQFLRVDAVLGGLAPLLC